MREEKSHSFFDGDFIPVKEKHGAHRFYIIALKKGMFMNIVDDADIVDMFLERNEQAIAETKNKYGKRLQNISFNITADRSAAEEAENDTYFTAWNNIPPKEPYDYLYAFLARIVRNASLSFCRSKSRLKRSAFVTELSEEMEQCIPSGEDIADKLDGEILAEKISSFLNGKSEEKRSIFMRRYWYLDSVQTIAKRSNLTESNVKVTLFRLRNELKEYLEKEGYNITT